MTIMTNSDILISWIIIGRNWSNEIEELISALTKQSWDNNIVELILVDDASTDNSSSALNNIQFENKKIIKLDQHSGRCGAQNAGIKEAQGKYCLFTQSNTIPEKYFLKKYINYLSDLKGDGVAGIIHYTCNDDAFQKYLNHPKRGLKKIQDDNLVPIDYVLFGNCAIKTKLLKDVNGFNEKLLGYGGEEIELLYRTSTSKEMEIFKMNASVLRINHPDFNTHCQRLIKFGSTNFKSLPFKIQKNIIPGSLLKICIILPISALFYIGLFPYIPGTVGSFFSFIFLIFICNFLSLNSLLFLFILIFIISYFSINSYIKNKYNKDPKEIVIDEFLGCFLIVLYIKYNDYQNIIPIIFYSFILFRIFDVFKLYPANSIDKNMKNSIGVILDDIVAGLYTIFTLIIIYEFII